MPSVHERLKQERMRLKMTQESFAEAAKAARRTLNDWEKGVSSPTAVQLSALYEHGVDVQYVLTGIKSINLTTGNEGLDHKQAALLDNVSHCSKEDQEAIFRMAIIAASNGSRETKDKKKSA